MSDENLSDSCICYIEKDLLINVKVDDVMIRFQKIKTRKKQIHVYFLICKGYCIYIIMSRPPRI